MKARKIFTPFEYILKGERGAERPTRFTLRGLTGLQVLEAKDHYSVDAAGISYNAAGILKLMSAGLVGWAGMDGDGGTVSFDEKDMQKNLDRLPSGVIVELMLEILSATFPAEDEGKN